MMAEWEERVNLLEVDAAAGGWCFEVLLSLVWLNERRTAAFSLLLERRCRRWRRC